MGPPYCLSLESFYKRGVPWYTQSNSVGYSLNGMMVGVGAGQQSRVDCVKLAGRKVATWKMRFHPKVMGLPFKDSCHVKGGGTLGGEIKLIN